VEVRREIQVQLALITALDEQLHGYDGEVRRQAARAPAARLLQSIPGIGPFGAMLLLAEIGNISRFASSHELAADDARGIFPQRSIQEITGSWLVA
jgi:transposase